MADLKKIPPLDWQTPLVNPETGYPSAQFIRLWQELFQNGDILNEGKADSDLVIGTTSPLTGGGDLTEDRTIGHDESGVVPGVYTSPEVTVDEFGHITDIQDGVGGGIELEEAGVPVTGGPFTTLNLVSGATAVDAGGGVADVTVSGGGGGSFSGARVVRSVDSASASGDRPFLDGASAIVEFDTAGFYDSANSWFVIPSGVTKVVVSANAQIGNSGGGDKGMRIRHTDSGGTIKSEHFLDIYDRQFYPVTTGVLSVVAGDLIKLEVYSSSSHPIQAYARRTWASIQVVG